MLKRRATFDEALRDMKNTRNMKVEIPNRLGITLNKSFELSQIGKENNEKFFDNLHKRYITRQQQQYLINEYATKRLIPMNTIKKYLKPQMPLTNLDKKKNTISDGIQTDGVEIGVDEPFRRTMTTPAPDRSFYGTPKGGDDDDDGGDDDMGGAPEEDDAADEQPEQTRRSGRPPNKDTPLERPENIDLSSLTIREGNTFIRENPDVIEFLSRKYPIKVKITKLSRAKEKGAKYKNRMKKMTSDYGVPTEIIEILDKSNLNIFIDDDPTFPDEPYPFRDGTMEQADVSMRDRTPSPLRPTELEQMYAFEGQFSSSSAGPVERGAIVRRQPEKRPAPSTPDEVNDVIEQYKYLVRENKRLQIEYDKTKSEEEKAVIKVEAEIVKSRKDKLGEELSKSNIDISKILAIEEYSMNTPPHSPKRPSPTPSPSPISPVEQSSIGTGLTTQMEQILDTTLTAPSSPEPKAKAKAKASPQPKAKEQTRNALDIIEKERERAVVEADRRRGEELKKKLQEDSEKLSKMKQVIKTTLKNTGAKSSKE